jgi:predicted enzyme related to lactoylglutathione lyase
MNRVTHFEIYTDSPETVRPFYEKLFGWKFNKFEGGPLEQTMKKIEQTGGKISVPKMAIPKVGWLAYAEDPAGNVFGIIEPDAEAK